MHKRENAGAYLFFLYPGHIVANALKSSGWLWPFYTILISLTRLRKSQNKDIGKYFFLKAKIYWIWFANNDSYLK